MFEAGSDADGRAARCGERRAQQGRHYARQEHVEQRGVAGDNRVRLVRRGFDEPAVDAVPRHVPKEKADNIVARKDPTTGGRGFLGLVGLMISVLGHFFVVGNRSGLLPTVSMFGLVIMAVGGGIMAAGRS